MGPKSLHFNGKEVYIGEKTDSLELFIAFGEFFSDGRPGAICFPFYSFDGRMSRCKRDERRKGELLKVALYPSPFNGVYYNMLDIEWPNYCFEFSAAEDWTPIAGTLSLSSLSSSLLLSCTSRY